jgi:DNA ligase-1
MKEIENKLEPKSWSQLYARASTGKIKTWQVGITKEPDGTAVIWTKHGLLGGKMQLKPKPIKVGKNIGKSNETTPYDQAAKQALSSYKRQIDKRYITELPTADNEPDILLPMLAEKILDFLHKVIYPCFGQSKFNGVRALSKKLTETQIRITSRKFKSYDNTLMHLARYLLPMMNIDDIFDGEVFLNGWTFQQILRHVKKFRPDTPSLQYWIYDIMSKGLAKERNEYYMNAIPDNHSHIIKVPTVILHNSEELEIFHRQNIAAGFEGTIVRNMNGVYKCGPSRSTDLLKKKDFIDGEFKIVNYEYELVATVDVETEEIVEQYAIMFICEVPGVGTFTAKPKGTIEARSEWYEEGESFIGKDLTVRFAEYTEDGLPFHGVGLDCEALAIRDYE